MSHHEGTNVEAEKREKLFPPEELSKNAYIKNMDQYLQMHKQSVEDPDTFWSEQAETLDWYKKWDTVYTWDPKTCVNTWFAGGKLNASYNCLDRHVAAGKGDKVAILWEGDEPGKSSSHTYAELLDKVSRFANVLKKFGVKKGDRVCIYLPMIPQLPVAMLACARIGAIHSVVFGGFSAEALRDRIQDSDCETVICADAGYRSGKLVPLKAAVDQALAECPNVKNVFVVTHASCDVRMAEGRDHCFEDELAAEDISADCPPEEMDAEDPLFILYTSGSTGKPKGVLHTTAGYLLHTTLSNKWIFDIHENDIWWCTADIGWVTGHSYIVYGPLANGFTEVMFEGVPTYPNPDRFWEVVEKYKVTQFYTAPTVIRSLMRLGDEWTRTHDLSSIKVLGSVGEPINPEVWLWYYDHIGGGRCPIVDTWWQTETGGILITPLAGATPMKPGSASFPFFGVDAVVLDQNGKECPRGESGFLCIKKPWPGMMRTVYRNHELFVNTYWSMFPGYYVSGDGCIVDEEGFYWLQGRIDDVINVSGHRLGTAEVESALVSHDYVSEAAVVGMPHDIKGQGIYAYVTLKEEFEGLDQNEVRKILVAHTRKEIGPIATPDVIHFTPALPKTRSGKIMRRVLRKIAEGTSDSLGDVSTLADPSVVDQLIEENKRLTASV